MIVEFLAAPATGKSYVSKKLEESVQELGYKCAITNEKYYSLNNRMVWRFKKVISIGILCIASPRIFLLISKLVMERTPLREKASSIYNTLSVIAINKKKEASDFIVIRDEGLFQVLFALNLFKFGNNADFSSMLAKFIKVPDLLVVLNTEENIETSLNLQGRKGRIFNSLRNGEIKQSDISNALDKAQIVAKEMQVNCLILNYSKSDESLAFAIKNVLKSIDSIE